jgi:hypothetical protein
MASQVVLLDAGRLGIATNPAVRGKVLPVRNGYSF